jgi:uncharacterized protein YdaU (DUF1376 family)
MTPSTFIAPDMPGLYRVCTGILTCVRDWRDIKVYFFEFWERSTAEFHQRRIFVINVFLN